MDIDDQGIRAYISNSHYTVYHIYDKGKILIFLCSEALHVAHLMASHGYFFPIDDHCLTVKNDNTFYRFQTPYFWPSNCWEPENTDYGIKIFHIFH